ncbi:flavin reductase family protein [Cellulomonas dongxiuzhuiae]|uniref:Flavin reductase family protein n=1 Tax=Cellulomonas dongxiuzhuiae TaxID=2819979 RepID=A0ABX8GK38_9CELL|nr:flavin reductase family protein [Cellulomonas dongxiuzhuiae]MBO3089612.1 flavin reductase family protein [Cellulomonas dongxiuzhuiae]MBO3095250.1 flavin reductase family protein [Cellulomonas dongxiuzhuiae]QWC16247.1 flavin reductase family protein [Cellulomonas dongxiuzhuiae]
MTVPTTTADVSTPAPEQPGEPVDPALLRRTFGSFPSGVVAVCATIDGAPVGMAASSFVTVSLDPPLVAFCVQWTSTTWPRLQGAARLGISVLGAGHNVAARQLASRSRDRFAGLATTVTPDGALFVHDASAWFDCSLREVVPAGDHGIVLLDVRHSTVSPDVEPLVYHASTFRALQRHVA